MLRVGCDGFPVGREKYWRSLCFVEAQTGEKIPRIETLAAWKSSAPAHAEFSIQALRLITHGAGDAGFPSVGKKLSPFRKIQCGGFRESLEVHEAWMSTKAAAEALGVRIIVFETPPSFLPSPDRLRDMYRFFKVLARGHFSFVWHPRGAWTQMGDKVCADLGLIRAFDPLKERGPQRGAFHYARLQGPYARVLSVDNLSTIHKTLLDRPSYLVFRHRSAFRDAERLASLLTLPRALTKRPYIS